MSSILKANLPQPPRLPATLPPIRYAAAAAAAVAPQQTPAANPQPPPTPAATQLSAPAPPPIPVPPPPAVAPSAPPLMATAFPSSSQDQSSAVPSSPSLTHPSMTSPMLSSASVSHQPEGSFYSGVDSPAISEAVPSSTGGPAAESPESRKGKCGPAGPSSLSLFPLLNASPKQRPYRRLPEQGLSHPIRPLRCVHTSFVDTDVRARTGVTSQTLTPAAAAEPQAPPQANGGAQTTPSAPSGPPPPLPLQQQMPSYTPQPPPPATATVAQPQPQFPPGVKVEQPSQQVQQQQQPQQQQAQPQPQSQPPQLQLQQPPSQAPQAAAPAAQPATGAQRPLAAEQQIRPAAFPGSLSDLVMSFETVKQKGAPDGGRIFLPPPLFHAHAICSSPSNSHVI
jgi:CCR4-NOT transcription complex subunit 3